MKNSNSTYIIGEIGQNHNGSVDIAKLIVDVVARPIKDELFNRRLKPIDAVKLTKRDLKEELTDSAMKKPYDSPHSFGKTYGEHREFLELKDEEHFEVYKHAKSQGIDFVETLTAKGALSLLKLFTPDRLKVASRDLTNLPLLECMAETKIPIILSTGMGEKKEIDDALEIISKYHSNIAILHCLSEYPAHYENINLNTIKYLQDNYSDYVIGYSDHSIGISVPVAAVAMGSNIIEKHITLDRRMKGTDQIGSLGVDGVWRMVRDIRNIEQSMGKKDIFISRSVSSAKHKLERSIATNKQLNVGHIITEKDLHMLSPGDGLKWSDRSLLLGKVVNNEVNKNEIIYSSYVK
ncbi:MAG: N-acetylneuraminate synthase family protein [Bacteroidota bacterium]